MDIRNKSSTILDIRNTFCDIPNSFSDIRNNYFGYQEKRIHDNSACHTTDPDCTITVYDTARPNNARRVALQPLHWDVRYATEDCHSASGLQPVSKYSRTHMTYKNIA